MLSNEEILSAAMALPPGMRADQMVLLSSKQDARSPVHFEYGHIFRDWQRFGFFSSLHYEIDRLTSLVYLEGLSHSAGHSLDGLTGIPDRKSFDDQIQRMLTQFKTDQKPFVCGIIDLDDFKKVNDTYGHQTGDFVLKEAAAFLKATLGPTDFVADMVVRSLLSFSQI